MAQLFAFPHHRLVGVDVPCGCSQEHGGWDCQVCAGGLALCATCGGAEGAMPTDCPGCEIEDEVLDAIQAGEVDYDAREGWVQRASELAEFCERPDQVEEPVVIVQRPDGSWASMTADEVRADVAAFHEQYRQEVEDQRRAAPVMAVAVRRSTFTVVK